MPKMTKEPSRAPVALAEHFPYSAEFECPSCGAGWSLEDGDAWGLTSVESKLAAVAQCPKDGCGSFAVATGGRGEYTARPPQTRLIRTDTLPIPVAQPPPARPRRERSIPAEPEPDPELVGGDDDEEDEVSAELGLRYYKRKRPPGLPDKVSYEDLAQVRERPVRGLDGGALREVSERGR
jgi:hypothetical protein